jgi:aldose 1-epimerase
VAALTVTSFGAVDGNSVELYALANGRLEAEILTYGGAIRTLRAPDRTGMLANVTLGLPTIAAYVAHDAYLGCITGRYANRIRNARFSLDGIDYQLDANAPPNALHGGFRGFDKRIWEAQPIERDGSVGVSLHRVSADGEERYPGQLSVRVDYLLTPKDELRLDYRARNDSADRATIVNLTNHAYWNLRGEGEGTALDHRVQLFADAYAPVDATQIPTGELAPVGGTPFDFRSPVALAGRIDADDEQLRLSHGYDHTFAVEGEIGELRAAARLEEPLSGRVLEVETTEPAIHLYSANFLDGTLVGLGGRPYGRRDAIALETQHFGDSPNQPRFPSTVLRPGEALRSTTVFRFTTLQ